MSPKYSVGVASSEHAKYHLPTADRSGAEPFTLVNSSMPIFTSFLPGFSVKGKSTRVWKLVVRLCLTVRVKGTFCCEGLKTLNWRLTNCFQFVTRAWRSPKLSPLAKTTFSALPPSSLHVLDGHGRGAVAARVVGDLALADIEQGFLARRPRWRRRPSPAGSRQPPGRCFERSSFSPPFACCTLTEPTFPICGEPETDPVSHDQPFLGQRLRSYPRRKSLCSLDQQHCAKSIFEERQGGCDP